jgi:DNA-directed RNA polymerase specialized sigma24 family protein
MYRKARKVEVNEFELGGRGVVDRGPEVLTEIEDLLNRLRKTDPRLRTIVELRVFHGKTAEEAAKAMGCSLRTVERCWNFARHWLATELRQSSNPE